MLEIQQRTKKSIPPGAYILLREKDNELLKDLKIIMLDTDRSTYSKQLFIVYLKSIFNWASWILSGSPLGGWHLPPVLVDGDNSTISCFAKVFGDKYYRLQSRYFFLLCHFWRTFSPYIKPASRGMQMRPSPRGGKMS